MSGDLEDFLRRAAQRRQAKAAEQAQAAPPAAKRPPQYSNIRSERVAEIVEDAEEILTAEIVEDDSTSIAARMKRLEEAKRAASEAEQASAAKLRQVRGMLPRQSLKKKTVMESPVNDLIEALKSPGGIKQAILLKEILDRPVDRW